MLNEIKLHGYLGRDPELTEHDGQNGAYKRVAFSLGVSRDYGDQTDWFYCVMYGKRAEVIEKYFSKGSEIILSGRMESYKPKDDPNRTNWLVKVSSFDFTGKSDGKKSDEPTAQDFEEIDSEEMPF